MFTPVLIVFATIMESKLSPYARFVAPEPNDQRARQRKLWNKVNGRGKLPYWLILLIKAAEAEAKQQEYETCYSKGDGDDNNIGPRDNS